ncbi:putative bacterial non-heme ferritin-like protein [Labeo rohita]|uniref:Bacterial non-heme ferritin-like protein n=1 Tax=Labeo rohita TaxID=84645 RepID=A0ABQ8L9I5_LABRO|nr:putative bacterial non-heme ferritin-like protein [Labeo rohita]
MHRVSDISVNCLWTRTDSGYFPSPKGSSPRISAEIREKLLSNSIYRDKNYQNRVDFNKTFSLTCRIQTVDSTEQQQLENQTKTFTYRVSVIDAVEAPVYEDSSIYESSCTQEEVTSSNIYTLRLNCIGDSIMCNYSNSALLILSTDLQTHS